MLNNGKIKLGNLGVAKTKESMSLLLNELNETKIYMSPEMISLADYSYKTDIW